MPFTNPGLLKPFHITYFVAWFCPERSAEATILFHHIGRILKTNLAKC